jgi:hydroxymethylpyrimidine pyrophosphatase-like HAD family hydrolase
MEPPAPAGVPSGAWMPYYFRAVAVDYDGTLTETPRPDPAVLDGICRARAAGLNVLLVTGRILAELRADFPDADEYFDAIVAENGAVVARPGYSARLLAEPIPPSLEQALMSRSIPLRRGEVLLATDAAHAAIIVDEIARLGLECQILYNAARSWSSRPARRRETASLEEAKSSIVRTIERHCGVARS